MTDKNARLVRYCFHMPNDAHMLNTSNDVTGSTEARCIHTGPNSHLLSAPDENHLVLTDLN